MRLRMHVVIYKLIPTKLTINNLEEKRRVAAYNFDRTVRQYLLYMKFDYTLEADGKKLATYPVNIDAILNYDSDFVLGEQEEERLIRHELRKDAARLVLLRFKSIAQ